MDLVQATATISPDMASDMPQKRIQIACDRCTQGVMDYHNDHLWGRCKCKCHDMPQKRIDIEV